MKVESGCKDSTRNTTKGYVVEWLVNILLFIIIGKYIGVAASGSFNISDQKILFLFEMLFMVIVLLSIPFKYSRDDVEIKSSNTTLKEFFIKKHLKKALERNEFILHYQPQVNLENKQVINCEALLRWNHPKMGIVPPGDFIPLAEKNGLIVPIGEWVLKEAINQLKIWHDMGFDQLKMSVNISARQLKQSNLADTISNILDSAGLRPEFLELEITENFSIQDMELAMQTVKRLKMMGIKIAIDDFGTGFSSLNYIRKFFADIIKIDKSFVWNVTDNPKDAALTTAIIKMANSLNIGVVAEGVETREQLSFLYSNGCKEIQGYFISPPIASDKFEKFLSKRLAIGEI